MSNDAFVDLTSKDAALAILNGVLNKFWPEATDIKEHGGQVIVGGAMTRDKDLAIAVCAAGVMMLESLLEMAGPGSKLQWHQRPAVRVHETIEAGLRKVLVSCRISIEGAATTVQ